MAKCISLGKINKSLLYVVLLGISNVLNGYIYGFVYIDCFYPMNIYKSFYNWIIDKNKEDFPRHRVFDPLFSYLGVAIISFFFLNKNQDNSIIIEEDEGKRHYSRYQLIFDVDKGYLSSKRGFIYFILIIILWIAGENLLVIYLDIFKDLDFWFFELICISVIFSLKFKFRIPSHRKLGVTISIIVGSVLKIYNIILSFTSNSDRFYSKNKGLISFVILYFFLITLRSYVNTEIKIFFDLKYITQKTLLMCYGLIGFVMCLLTGVFTSNVPCSEGLRGYVCNMVYNEKLYYDNFFNYYESYKNMLVRLIIIVLGLLTYFGYVYFYTLIIKYYTPIHAIFFLPIQYFIEKFFLLIFTTIFFTDLLLSNGENLSGRFLADIFGDIGSIIGFLIYLEVIELNFCGLNFNLKKNIIRRGTNDYIESLLSAGVSGVDNFFPDEEEGEQSIELRSK